jgi:proline racemase
MSRARRSDLPRDAPLLAQDRAALDSAGWRRNVEAARYRSVDVKLNIGRSNRGFEFQKCRQRFIRTQKESVTVAAMCVCNPDRSPVGTGSPIFSDDSLRFKTASDQGV